MSYDDVARDDLLDGEAAQEIGVFQDGSPDHWLIVVFPVGGIGKVVAECDGDENARGVAAALAHTLDCPVLNAEELAT